MKTFTGTRGHRPFPGVRDRKCVRKSDRKDVPKGARKSFRRVARQGVGHDFIFIIIYTYIYTKKYMVRSFVWLGNVQMFYTYILSLYIYILHIFIFPSISLCVYLPETRTPRFRETHRDETTTEDDGPLYLGDDTQAMIPWW